MQIVQPPTTRTVISLTPLIDVVFILLIFFMLATSFSRYSSMSIDAAVSSAIESAQSENIVTINMSDQGHINIEGQQMTQVEAVALLAGVLAEKPNTTVVIRPHSRLAVQNVVSMLDELSSLSITDVTLMRYLAE